MKNTALPVVEVIARRPSTTKRLIDVVVAGISLLALAPVILVVAFLIKVDSPGPVLFIQRRVGRAGMPFKMYKFRTMTRDAEEQLAWLQGMNKGGRQLIRIPADPRVTRIGRWLRPLGLDELPQLLNVLRGDMSIVGPRPQAPDEVLLYDSHQRRRLEVLPGITGLWQVTSRQDPSFDQWVRCDLDYIDGWSLLLDVRIVAKTPLVVARALLSWRELPTQSPPDAFGQIRSPGSVDEA